MRHGKSFNHLGRTSTHRKALLSNMATSLILHKRIRTTVAKAKALRVYVEPLITRSKTDTTHNRRMVFSYLQNKEAIKELFSEVSDKIANRPGGYTRIIRLNNRAGDNAEMAFIELVDFNTIYVNKVQQDTTTTQKKRTRRAGTAKKADNAVETKPKAEVDTTKSPKPEATNIPSTNEDNQENSADNIENKTE